MYCNFCQKKSVAKIHIIFILLQYLLFSSSFFLKPKKRELRIYNSSSPFSTGKTAQAASCTVLLQQAFPKKLFLMGRIEKYPELLLPSGQQRQRIQRYQMSFFKSGQIFYDKCHYDLILYKVISKMYEISIFQFFNVILISFFYSFFVNLCILSEIPNRNLLETTDCQKRFIAFIKSWDKSGR